MASASIDFACIFSTISPSDSIWTKQVQYENEGQSWSYKHAENWKLCEGLHPLVHIATPHRDTVYVKISHMKNR